MILSPISILAVEQLTRGFSWADDFLPVPCFAWALAPLASANARAAHSLDSATIDSPSLPDEVLSFS